MILLTGGAGYIGTHCAAQLVEAGEEVLVLDNFSNSSIENLKNLFEISGVKIQYIKGSVNNASLLRKIFEKYKINSVIHFAGLKSVSESFIKPISYYEVNVTGTICLLREMEKANIFNLIFSSSATVYGNPKNLPLLETHPIGNALNPYGQTKKIIEFFLSDLSKSNSNWKIGILRYFNPIGAHPSGFIGENPTGQISNVMPLIMKVAYGELPHLSVFGDTYETPDGTGIRDYIHVIDLADGHISALNHICTHGGYNLWNLGTGKGYSVLELIKCFEINNKVKINFKIEPKRSGDVAVCFSDPGKAFKDFKWKAKFGLKEMVEDSWRAFLFKKELKN